jgi:hypothetical protein
MSQSEAFPILLWMILCGIAGVWMISYGVWHRKEMR